MAYLPAAAPARRPDPPLPALSLAQLELFKAVFATGSISEAAQGLGMSQPSASRMLRRLEDRLGYRLFVLHKGRVLPTEEARLLVPAVELAFEQFDRVRRAALRLRGGGRSEPLVIGSPTSLAMAVLPTVIRALTERFPALEVTLDARRFSDQVRAIERGEMHLGIGVAARPPAGLEWAPLGETPFFLLTRPDHPLASAPLVTLDDLTHWPWVRGMPVSPITAWVNAALGARSIDSPSPLHVEAPVLCAPLVREFGMLAVVDGFTARLAGQPGDLLLRPLPDLPPAPVGACWRAGTSLSGVGAAFVALMRARLRALQRP